MGFRSYVKRTVKTSTNIKEWSGWGLVKGNAHAIKSIAEDLKSTASGDSDKVAPDSFESAMKLYGWSEADVARRMTVSLWTAGLCTILFLVALGWAFHLFFMGLYMSSLGAFGLSFLMFAYGFREHFFYFQLKQRRLNCTFSDWVSFLLKPLRGEK